MQVKRSKKALFWEGGRSGWQIIEGVECRIPVVEVNLEHIVKRNYS